MERGKGWSLGCLGTVLFVYSLPYLAMEWELHLGGAKIAPDRNHYASLRGPHAIVVDRLPCGVIFAPPSALTPNGAEIADFGWQSPKVLWVRLKGVHQREIAPTEAEGVTILWKR